MDSKNLKYVVSGYQEGMPAVIRFYGDVDDWNVADFNAEFAYLEEWVRPSKIVILINSAGGSVIEGMSTFSIINGCKIPTECVIEGIAASMGSIIWAAGKRQFMHDYSILMIHNPFMCCGDCDDPSVKQAIDAFKAQLKMIYMKRFNMSEEQVTEIMDGKDGADGTYMTADEAVNAGFLPESHVIATEPALFNTIKKNLEGIQSAVDICHAMAATADQVNGAELLAKLNTITTQIDNSHSNSNEMEKDVLFKSVAAQLGLSEESDIATVSAAITEYQNKAKELETLKAEKADLDIKLAGANAKADNLEKELNDTKAALQVYKDAESAARENEINALIDEAIASEKIAADSKEAWVNMAHSNLDMVKSTLESIPARQIITQQIADDPQNKKAADAALQTAEEEMAKKVREVVGEVKFRTF